jgi:hypothetical protein
VFSYWSDVLRDLDAGGAGADYGYAFVFEVHAVLGSGSRVEVFAFEVAEAFEIGCVAAGCEADSGD